MEATENLQSADAVKHTLVAKGLKKHYGSRQVVKGVDLSVKSGEVVGLLGPNGAGKTTTFYMVVGLVVADDGTIELDGKSIIHQPIYRRARMGLSYLPQEASVFRKLTVEDNIRAILEMQLNDEGRPLSSYEVEERLEKLLDELQIKHIRTNPALSLSGGERQRISIARAFLKDAPIILLDEATASLDVENETLIQTALSRLIRNKTVLIIAHRMRTVAGADKIVVLADGVVAEQGSPNELYATNGLYTHMVDLQNGSQNWSL